MGRNLHSAPHGDVVEGILSLQARVDALIGSSQAVESLPLNLTPNLIEFGQQSQSYEGLVPSGGRIGACETLYAIPGPK